MNLVSDSLGMIDFYSGVSPTVLTVLAPMINLAVLFSLATVRVEINADAGTDKDTLEAALQRGVAELRIAVQEGITSAGIKSVTAEISERFSDE